MKDYLGRKAAGFYISIVAAILGMIGLILYQGVRGSKQMVIMLLGAAVILEVIVIVVTLAVGEKRVFNLLAVIQAVLFAVAFVNSFSTQINQIGYVIAGLDTIDILSGFITAAAFMGAAMLVSVVSCFFSQSKQ